MSLLKRQKRSLTYLMILAVLVLTLLPMGGATALAQDVPGYVRRVWALESGLVRSASCPGEPKAL
jgi:hypothetical protein